MYIRSVTGFPAISHYIDTLSNPHGMFRTLFSPVTEKDSYGEVKFRAGNSAAIFKVNSAGRNLMLKCYIKQAPRTREICSYISCANEKLLGRPKLMEKELYVFDDFDNGRYYDIVVDDWIEGITLETAIQRAATEYGAPMFTRLASLFDRMAAELLSRKWAHGDVKPDNIILRDDQSLILIDYDAMYIPEFKGEKTTQTGTPSYQHPIRETGIYDIHIDDYALGLICVSLHALAIDPGLYHKYNTCDKLLMEPSEVISGKSDAYREILDLLSSKSTSEIYALALSLQNDSYIIPDLDKIIAKIIHPRKDTTHTKVEQEQLQLYLRNGRWGYRTSEGTLVTEPIYEHADEFREGLATVKINGKWKVIDPSGRVVIEGEYERIKPFSEGVAAFEKDGLWGYLNKDGSTRISPRYQMAGYMVGSRAVVRMNGKYGFIDPDGTVIIKAIYDYAENFHGEHAIVYLDGEILKIDHFGNIS